MQPRLSSPAQLPPEPWRLLASSWPHILVVNPHTRLYPPSSCSCGPFPSLLILGTARLPLAGSLSLPPPPSATRVLETRPSSVGPTRVRCRSISTRTPRSGRPSLGSQCHACTSYVHPHIPVPLLRHVRQSHDAPSHLHIDDRIFGLFDYGRRILTCCLARNSCLGIQSMQTYSYLKRYPLDKTFYKLLVRQPIH